MRFLSLAVALALFTLPAAAQTGISAEIGATGLKATEARLARLQGPTDEERFALGGVRFLSAIEKALQLRWSADVPEELLLLPVLRLTVAANPSPEPFDPQAIAELFRDMSGGLAAARQPLADIAADSAFGLTVDLGDLWFDINANDARDDGEDLLLVAGPLLAGPRQDERDPAAPAPVIRFDVADAAWLSAYCHLLGGLSATILAYDPTEAIRTVLDSRTAFAALDPVSAPASSYAVVADTVSVLLRALDQVPDAVQATTAREELLAMVEQNRLFWQRVALETDNAAEWLPNDRQTSALGIVVPPGTGTAWMAVLDESAAVLRGEALLPFWRVDTPSGVNVGRMFTEPRPIDVAGWIQGADALPYLEQGRVTDGAAWNRFLQLVSGNGLLFAVFLN